MWWVVDRVENGRATFVRDDGREITIPVSRAVAEGQVYRANARGILVRDLVEQRKRVARARAQLQQLRAKDPGGNIQL